MEQAHNYLSRSRKIVNELLISLNFEAGGEIAINLKRLYLFIIDNIFTANLKKDSSSLEKIDNCISILKTLREAWANIEQKPKIEEAAAENKVDKKIDKNEVKKETRITAYA
ncbi:MAG: flagellar export chaperone FliS [bacterium]